MSSEGKRWLCCAVCGSELVTSDATETGWRCPHESEHPDCPLCAGTGVVALDKQGSGWHPCPRCCAPASEVERLRKREEKALDSRDLAVKQLGDCRKAREQLREALNRRVAESRRGAFAALHPDEDAA